MKHKIDTAVFSQGWLEGQIEENVRKTAEKAMEDPSANLMASMMQEQWTVVSQTMDELIQENAELNRKLLAVRIAIG